MYPAWERLKCKAYVSIYFLWAVEGLKEISCKDVLNANYPMSKLRKYFDFPFDQICKHELFLSGLHKNEKDMVKIDYKQ